MIKNTEPLIFDDADREDPILAMTRDDDRIVPLILEKRRLLMRHTQCHLLGLDHSPTHTAILNDLGQVTTMLNACWTAPLN